MTPIFGVEGFPRTKTTVPVQPSPVDFCQIPCHLRPALCIEHPNPATDTSRRKRHNTGGHNRGSVRSHQSKN